MKNKKQNTNMEEMAEKFENTDNSAKENNRQAFENASPETKDAENNNAEAFEKNDDAIAELHTSLNEQKEKYIRLMAEFENYKRRTNQEKLDIIQTASKDVLVSMLEILDDMDRAEVQIEQDTDIQQVKEGVKLVFTKFRNLLLSKGIKYIETTSEYFDPEIHEAIANVPAQTPDMQGRIIDEVQKGYRLNDKIIRFPKVVVGK